jgi:hypothetical protein
MPVNGFFLLIDRKDGSIFEVLPITPKGSPLDVKGVDVGLDAAEIVSLAAAATSTR